MFRYKSWCFVSLATPLHWKTQQIASPTFKVWSSSWTVSTIVTPESREAESLTLLCSRLAALWYWWHLGHVYFHTVSFQSMDNSSRVFTKYTKLAMFTPKVFLNDNKINSSKKLSSSGFDPIIWIVCRMLYHPLTKNRLEWMYFIVSWHNALKALQFSSHILNKFCASDRACTFYRLQTKFGER